MIARLRYYLTSIPTLVMGIRNWPTCATLPFRRTPLTLTLRNGLRFRVRSLMDVWTIKEVCLDRDYERHGTPIQDGWTVIDVGAAAGDFAIAVASAHPTVTVFAYEPSPESFALLEDNIRLNGISNIVARSQALGASGGILALSTAGPAVQHSTARAAAADSVPVRAITLEDVFRMHAIERCDFLKLDCEGGEFDVLLAAPAETLARIARMCMEYHDGFTRFSHTDLQAHLEQHGFRVRTTPNPVHRYLGFLYADRTL